MTSQQTLDALIEATAAACHEANRRWCQLHGDDSQPTWEDAPTWQKESARAGARQINNFPNTTPEESHAGWMATKTLDGWKHGPVKDPVKKEHPCMVPYGALPMEQLNKDRIFGMVARSFLFAYRCPQPDPIHAAAVLPSPAARARSARIMAAKPSKPAAPAKKGFPANFTKGAKQPPAKGGKAMPKGGKKC